MANELAGGERVTIYEDAMTELVGRRNTDVETLRRLTGSAATVDVSSLAVESRMIQVDILLPFPLTWFECRLSGSSFGILGVQPSDDLCSFIHFGRDDCGSLATLAHMFQVRDRSMYLVDMRDGSEEQVLLSPSYLWQVFRCIELLEEGGGDLVKRGSWWFPRVFRDSVSVAEAECSVN